jgi:hypothetical protein
VRDEDGDEDGDEGIVCEGKEIKCLGERGRGKRNVKGGRVLLLFKGGCW